MMSYVSLPTYLLLLLSIFLAESSTSSLSAEEPTKLKRAFPGEACKKEPLKGWTLQEQWVWTQVCEGEIADFNKAEGYGGELDPRKPEDWPKNRILRSTFLETILLNEHYRSALHRKGVRIVGGWFTDSLDLSDSTIDNPLWLDKCRFKKDIKLNRLNSTSYISIDGSRFNAKLNMNGIEVQGSIFMREAEFNEVDLGSAKIGSQISMKGSTFKGKLNMNGLEVQTDLFMDGEAEFNEIDLVGAKIGSQLVMNGSTFNGKLDMEGIEVKQHLLMRGVKVTTQTPVDFTFADIGGGLNLSKSNLNSMKLTGTHVEQVFHLGSEYGPSPIWKPGAKLTLQNTVVGALQDLPGSWPDELELDGFTYSSLGGSGGDNKNDMDGRKVSWLTEWIEKDKTYSPQVYEQLASVLEREGHKGKARDILYYGKKEELREAEWTEKPWLILKWIFIGHGYRVYYAGFWALGFVLSGMSILYTTKSGPSMRTGVGSRDQICNFFDIFFYSLDKLLPIIKLDKRHDDIPLPDGVRYYFYVHHFMGYLLGFFLIGGLSGLVTK